MFLKPGIRILNAQDEELTAFAANSQLNYRILYAMTTMYL